MSIITDVVSVWKSLKKSEQRELNSGAMNHPCSNWLMRCKVIRNLVRGESPTMIARILGCSRTQVYRVANRFVEDGLVGLIDLREANGPTKVNEPYRSLIVRAVAGSPQDFGFERPSWTQELLVIVAGNELGVTTSTATISRLLSEIKARHGRPKPYVMCPWPKSARTRRLNQIRQLESNLDAGDYLFYADEVDIHLNPKIGFDWMLPGQQKTVLTPGKNQKQYLAGALNHSTGQLTWVEGVSKNGALFIKMVDHLMTTYDSARILHIVLDNVKIHSSLAVQAAKLRWGDRVKFHFLPPYCPDYNRIERYWKDLHDNVTRNHTCQGMNELMQNVTSYLNQRNAAGRHALAQCG
jgi:transposase